MIKTRGIRALASFLGMAALLTVSGCAEPATVIIRGGTIYDGSGAAPVAGDLVIQGDRAVSYTHLTLPTNVSMCRSRWSPYH